MSAKPISGPKVTLVDYGPTASEWLSKVLNVPEDAVALTGTGDAYTRSVHVNPDQGDPLPNDNNDDHFPVSLADEAPYLLTSQASLNDLNHRLRKRGKDPVDMRRFRPNLVLSSQAQPWEEDTWARIRIGDRAEFYVWQRCGRCTMTTIDRDTLERGPEPLATLSTFRERAHGQRNFGMHLIPVKETMPAVLAAGDKVTVLEYRAFGK